jgi:hypothetical protein
VRKSVFKPLISLFIGLVLIIAFIPTASMAQQMTRIAGKMKAAYTKQDSIVVGDTEGHLLTLGISEGTNVSATEHKFMEGARIINYSFGDLVKGNGSHQGYVKFAENGDTAFAKWQGKITTTLSAEGTPLVKFEGTTTWIKGTGKFENIRGTGTYKGGFISKTEYEVEWAGDYYIKE